jgi:hypothetical protein
LGNYSTFVIKIEFLYFWKDYNIKITLTRNKDPKQLPWTAVSDTCKRVGTGHTSAAAVDCLIRANLDTFGVTEWITNDYTSDTPEVIWKSCDQKQYLEEGINAAKTVTKCR